ncbi:MAG: phage portal protein, partial [Oscillospiraceae bacterium]
MTGKTALQYTGDLNDNKEKVFTANMEQYIDGKIDGVRNLIPIPSGTALVPLNVKLADSQFLELRKYTALQVAAAFGVKPDQINDYEKSSYNSSETQQIAFLVDTLLWIVENYEQEISYKLLTKEERAAGFAAKFNTGVILRTTTDKQIESLAKGVANSIYKPNEARNHLDMCHAPGGDRLYAGNGSVIPLELAGIQYGKKGGENND